MPSSGIISFYLIWWKFGKFCLQKGNELNWVLEKCSCSGGVLLGLMWFRCINGFISSIDFLDRWITENIENGVAISIEQN